MVQKLPFFRRIRHLYLLGRAFVHLPNFGDIQTFSETDVVTLRWLAMETRRAVGGREKMERGRRHRISLLLDLEGSEEGGGGTLVRSRNSLPFEEARPDLRLTRRFSKAKAGRMGDMNEEGGLCLVRRRK